MSEITHYWSIVEAISPFGVTWKLSDGSIVYGCADEGSLPKETRLTEEPTSIIGYHPVTREYGYKFGDWIPVSDWLKRSEL